MDRRRLAALALLKRLKKHEMEIDARELGDLRHETAELNQKRQNLVDDIRQQNASSDDTLTPYMRRFLPAAKAEILSLHESITKLEPQIETLEERVSHKFKEFKTFDIIHDSLDKKIQHEQQAREVADAEEVILSRWARK